MTLDMTSTTTLLLLLQASTVFSSSVEFSPPRRQSSAHLNLDGRLEPDWPLLADTDQPQESEPVPTTSPSRKWEKPIKSVEFSSSGSKRVSPLQPEIPEEPQTSKGTGRSIEFSKGQAIVFPSSPVLPPVQYPTENVDKEEAKDNNGDSGQIDTNKIDSISNSSIREISSRELDPTSSNEPKQGVNSGSEFESNLVDDNARVAPQILAANIPSYQPSYPNRDPKLKDKQVSPVSSSATSSSSSLEDSSPKENLATRSAVESRLVVVVGTLTVLALVLVLLVMLLLCRQRRLKKAKKQKIDEDLPLSSVFRGSSVDSTPVLCSAPPPPPPQTEERSEAYPMQMYLSPTTAPASSDAPVPEDMQESPDIEGGLPYFTVSQIMAGSNLSKPNFIDPLSDSSAARPVSSVSSRSSISYVEPYIPLSVLTSASSSVASSSNSSPAYATPVTFETFQSASSSIFKSAPSSSNFPPTFSLIQSAMVPLAPQLPPLPTDEVSFHRKPSSASDQNSVQSRPLQDPTDSISSPKCDPVQSPRFDPKSTAADNLPSPMPLLTQSKNLIGRSKSEKPHHLTEKPSLGYKPKLPSVEQQNMSDNEEAKSISNRKPMPPPRPPSLSFLPPALPILPPALPILPLTLSILPPTPPITPGPYKEPLPPTPVPSSPIASDNHPSFPSPPPLPKSPMPLNSASRRSPSPQPIGSDWKEDLPTNELFRSQRQKVGTSTMVSSVVRDWNGRNKKGCRNQETDGMEHKEETKMKWKKAVKHRDSSDVDKLNEEGNAREIESNLQKGAEESFDEQKIISGKAKGEELQRKQEKVEEVFTESDKEVYAKNKEMYAKDEELYAKESEEMYARNEEVYARAKESFFCWPPSGPSQPKRRQMPKETKGFSGPKNQRNSLRKAAGGSESGASCWSDNWSVWGSDFPGTIRSNPGQPDSEEVNLVAIHAYQGGEPGTIAVTSGEQLRLMGKEESGWVRVKRINSDEEGYVPASYTNLPTTTRL